jgi:sugar phosphate isomerase/epimerase
MLQQDFSRRGFVASAALVSGAALLSPTALALDLKRAGSSKVIAFSKPFQKLDARETSELVAEVGWDGIEMPVRKGGQVVPERVDEDLPRYVEALRDAGRELTIATTDVTDVTPTHERVLRTVAKLGVKRVRLGNFNYVADRPLPEQLAEMTAKLRDVAALCKELGLHAGFQNHSGAARVGAPVWDIWFAIRELPREAMGICFDIGHATIEGGMAWATHFRLARPWLMAVFVKDFAWEKSGGRWRAAWCPLGEGMVEKNFFKQLRSTDYDGPICQHHEYDLGDRAQMMAHFKKDLATLRSWLAA